MTGIPAGRLEEVISDEDVATIARKHLTDWESLSPYLGLSRQQKVEIRSTFQDCRKQKQECLEVWKELKGKGATYGALIAAAEKADNQQLSDRVRDMLRPNVPSTYRKRQRETRPCTVLSSQQQKKQKTSS